MASQTSPKPEVRPAYALAIKEAREAAKLSQRVFGQLVGCNQPAVANIESGRHRPSPALLGLMQSILGIKSCEGDHIALRDEYLKTRREKRVSVMVTSTRRWPLSKVQGAVLAVTRTNTKTLEDLLAMDGDKGTLDEFFAELCAHTESFINALCKVSGWVRSDILVSSADLVSYSSKAAARPEPPEAPPAWLTKTTVEEMATSTEEAAPEVFEAAAYVPYVPAPKAAPVPPSSPRIKALVVSNDTEDFDRRYGDKLAVYAVDVVKVIEERSGFDSDASNVDLIIVCKFRMGHSRWYAAQAFAKKFGKRIVAIDPRSTTWGTSLGMIH